MSLTIYKLLGLAFLLYALVPTILGRILHWGVFWHGDKTCGKVAITFDDGPDPEYTPKLLGILRQYNAKASFFMVGQQAAKYPQLVKQIMADGHTLGTHGYSHRLAWLQGPVCSLREIKKGNQVIQQITGKSPQFFRPSWGVFNLTTLIYFWLTGHKVVLWSFMSHDWSPHTTQTTVVNIVQRKIRSGSVVVFHDRCTRPGADEKGPAKMLEALPKILDHLQQRNLQPVTVDELFTFNRIGLVKRLLRRLWRVWEFGFEKLAGLKPVGGNNLFRLAVRKHRGSVMQLPDGTLLKPGDQIGELHFNNDQLQKINTTARSIEQVGVKLLKEAKNSLPLLAKVVAQDPSYQGVKAFVGITMIYRGSTKLGFSVYDLSPFTRPIVAWYQMWLLFLLHPGGLAHLRRQWDKLVPKKIIISRQELLARYLDGIG
ncbi:polysaccharide deacetylase family protein [Desulfotomaculum nigrificans]|uniref:polysaccharide deacetylase family protein n=1 Tax=Desulfotomaculum nigrificans TaxID=1565 RepID=UPI0001FAEC3E|nr:polysaccharide deacetylase family protein [Desulfotomaculum nigrificans]